MTTNELNTEQFNNIKINGVLKTTIEATQGDIIQMNALFGSTASTSEAEGGIGDGYRNFSYYGGLFSRNQRVRIGKELYLIVFDKQRING